MNDRLMLAVMIIFVLALCFVCSFTNVCEADNNDYYATMISFFVRQIGDLRLSLADVRGELADTREEQAEMRGEIRGRQNAMVGVAAGTPTGLAGLLFWWLRREKRKNGK